MQLTPRTPDGEALPDLMRIDSTRFADSNCAAEPLLLPGRASQLPMFSAHSAERVPVAHVGSKRGDGNHDATVGLSGAPDDRVAPGVAPGAAPGVAPGVAHHDPLFAARPREPLPYSYAAGVFCEIARMRFPGAQLRR